MQLHAMLFERTGQGEDVADVVVNDNHLAPREQGIAATELLQGRLRVQGQIFERTMQNKRDIVLQLRRARGDAGAFSAPPQFVQVLLLFFARIARHEDDQRFVGIAQRLHEIGQGLFGRRTQIEHDAIKAVLGYGVLAFRYA